MSPQEQTAALRSAILVYLNTKGPAAKSVIAQEIGAPRSDTLQRALNNLANTQQIYADVVSGSRDPSYRPNGKLAHPMAQRILDCGLYQYAIQAYEDRLMGRYVTITQYAVLPSGERKPLGGIRLDWVDLEGLVRELSASLDVLSRSTGLVISEEQSRGTYKRR